MTFDDMLRTGRKRRVVLVQAHHEESLLTMAAALREGIADFSLIGDRNTISAMAEKLKIPLDGVDIRQTGSDEEASFIAAGMAAAGDADVIMKGMVHTAIFTKALLNKERNLVSPGGLISHIGLFELAGMPHPFFLTDAAINIDPTLEQKEEILCNAIAVCRSLGIKQPKVACIAPVEKVTAKIPSTVDADLLSRMNFNGVIVEGPMALDVALSSLAAAIKGIESRVAGYPDILLMPELNSANAVYKAFTFSPGSRNAGILAGVKVPVVLTSRSESEDTRFLSLKLALAVGNRDI